LINVARRSKGDSEDAIAARRQELIRAWRIFPDGPFEATMRAATADDLTWLVDRIDEQFKSTPLHVKDPRQLEEAIKNLSHCRSVVAQILGHKHTLERQRDRRTTLWRANAAIFTSVGSLIVAIIALVWTLTRSGK
jgi:hypothetical protein